MGILQSAYAVGGATGPFLGGLAASRIGFSHVFIAGGVLVLASALPVHLIIRRWLSPSLP